MPTIQEHKQRVLSTRGNPKEERNLYSELIINSNYAGSIQVEKINTITVEEINEYLRMVINIPTLLSINKHVRPVIYKRVSYYMKYHSEIINTPVREILEQYFDWLKERDDYVESSEDKKTRKRITARANAVRQELIETLYHPDRYMKMVASYGEVWADIHMPY
jgi:hypothetical protein